MTRHMVRYRVKPDQVGRNEELVRALFAELRAVGPAGLRYTVFKLSDGVTFIHLIGRDRDGHGPLPQLEALREFHAGLRDRCEEAPSRTELAAIDSFGPPGDNQP